MDKSCGEGSGRSRDLRGSAGGSLPVANQEASAKHTPGPWAQAHRRCTDGMHRTQVFAIASPDEEIATVHWYPVEVGPGHTATCREANARLIAAAPELLAALKELDAVLGDTPMPNCAAMNRLIAASSKARAAIAKAEGAQ